MGVHAPDASLSFLTSADDEALDWLSPLCAMREKKFKQFPPTGASIADLRAQSGGVLVGFT
jgi:hypothetical protein